MHDIITIGSATVDIFMKSNEFHLQPTREQGILLCEKYDEKLNVEECVVASGGAGTNTAVGFRRMGFRVAAVVEMGKDLFAQIVWDDLKKEKVMTDFVVTEKSEKTAVSVLLISGDGGRTALTHRGAASQLEARDLPWQAIQQTRWVHLSNVGGEPELLLRLFDHLSQSLGGLSWNPGSKELALLAKKALLIQHVPCNIFCVNKEEWVSLGSVCDDVRAHVPIVVVTDGKKGGVVYGAQHYEYAYKGEKVATVQETGAGDAFIVGFVSAHLYGLDIASCVRWGNRNAASVVTHIGAKKGLLRRGEIEQMGK